MKNEAREYEANGFRDRDYEPNSRFVSVSPDFPCRGHEGAHVQACFFMSPAQARRLAAKLCKAADYADGIDVDAAKAEG